MSVVVLAKKLWSKVLAVTAFSVATILTVSIAPTFATEPPTTRLAIHLTGSTQSGDDVPVSANVLNLQVFEGTNSIYDSNAYADSGCTLEESIPCDSALDSGTLSNTIIFSDVPVSSTAQYYVQYDISGGVNPGTFNRFIKIGDNQVLPNFGPLFTGLSSSWTGVAPDPTTKSLTLQFADSGDGHVSGSAFRKDNLNTLGNATILADGVLKDGGDEYLYRGSTVTDEIGRYSLSQIPANASIQIAFLGWPGAEWDNPYLAENRDLGYAEEKVLIRETAPDRQVNLYVDKSHTELPFPHGDFGIQGQFIGQNGEPVASGLPFHYELTASNGVKLEDFGQTPNFEVANLAAGTYQITFDAVNLFPAVSRSLTVGENYSDLDIPVVTYPTGTANIRGQLDVLAETVPPDEPSLSITVLEFADAHPNLGSNFENFVRNIRRSNLTGNWEVVGEINEQEGSWEPANLPDGKYRIQVNSPNWTGNAIWSLIQPFTVEIINGVSVITDPMQIRQLVPGPDQLRIKVKDSQTRLNIPGIICNAYIYSDEYLTSVRGSTDINGVATLDGVFRGATYNVMCYGDGGLGGVSIQKNAVQIHEGTNNLLISLVRHIDQTILHGRVVDNNGEPLSGMRINAGQIFEIPDCECGEGVAYSDLTDEDGIFEFGPFAIGQETTIRVEDPRGHLARKTLRFVPTDLGETTSIDDVVMNAGATLTGHIDLAAGQFGSTSFTLVDPDYAWGNNAIAIVGENGDISFAEQVPTGEYKGLVEVLNPSQLGTYFAHGWVTDEGHLTASQHDARNLSIVEGSVDLESITISQGSTISGNVRFVDGSNRELISWSYAATINLYVHNSFDEWELSRNLSGRVDGGDGNFALTGLPDGEYKICFADVWTSINRYELTCNGGAASLDSAVPIVVTSGDFVSGVNATIRFKQPEVAPQPVSLDDLDAETYLALQDQIEILTRDSGSTVVQLDPDMAGQWVAAEVIPEGTTAPAILSPYQAPQPASFTNLFARVLSIDVTAWLQVDADGRVEIPSSMLASDQTGQIALLSSTSNLLGWTDLAAVEPGDGSSTGGTTTTPHPTASPVPEETVATPVVTEEPVEKTADTGVEAASGVGAGTGDSSSTGLLVGGGLVLAVLIVGVSVAVRRGRHIR